MFWFTTKNLRVIGLWIRLHWLPWMFWFTKKNQQIRVINSWIRLHTGCPESFWLTTKNLLIRVIRSWIRLHWFAWKFLIHCSVLPSPQFSHGSGLLSATGAIILRSAWKQSPARRSDSPQLGTTFRRCVISLRLLHSWYGSKVPWSLRQNESIVPSHFGLENRNFSFSAGLSTRCNYRRVKL